VGHGEAFKIPREDGPAQTCRKPTKIRTFCASSSESATSSHTILDYCFSNRAEVRFIEVRCGASVPPSVRSNIKREGGRGRGKGSGSEEIDIHIYIYIERERERETERETET
jgi:hypothetical protein